MEEYGLLEFEQDFKKLISLAKPFTEDEILSYLKTCCPYWDKMIEKIDSEELGGVSLLPVGIYIGCRQLTKLMGYEVNMKTFYE